MSDTDLETYHLHVEGNGSPNQAAIPGSARSDNALDGKDKEMTPERYLVHLAHLDMPLPMKIELIRVLRDIMQSFVDRAFGDDPVQQALRAGSAPDKMDAPGGPDMVGYDPSQNQNFDLVDDFGRSSGNRGGRKK